MYQFDVRQFSSNKILKHLDRIDDWLKGKNPSPITVELDMTNSCNHKCPKCVSYNLSDNNFISHSFAVNIIKQLARNKIKGLIFTGGGEPLCNSYTLEMVKLAKRKGLDVGFITNGSLLNQYSAKVILENCVWIRVSLDAASPKIFKLMHGRNEEEYQKILRNIELLVETKTNLKSNCTIGVGFLTCSKSEVDMVKSAILCKKLGIDYLQFRPLQNHNEIILKYHNKNINKKISICLKYSDNNFKVLYSRHKYEMINYPDFGRCYGKCYGQQFAAVISATGKMYICCHTRGYKKYCIGDLKKESFKEIWNSKRRQEIIKNIDFKDCTPLCRDNTFNQILWNIKQPIEHINFL